MKIIKPFLLTALLFPGTTFPTLAQSFNNLPVTTQKPPLHGRHWMAITGKPLAATAGAMVFAKGGNVEVLKGFVEAARFE